MEDEEEIKSMLYEWKKDIELNKGNHSPRAIFRNDFSDFNLYLDKLERKEAEDLYVPDSVFFCKDLDRDYFVGAVNIRHYLNDDLLYTGGHIGDGIRPSERFKGYGTKMLSLALGECKKLGINKVLICCDKDNIPSAKTIIRNGGILENEVIDENNKLVQRYWINLS